MGFLLVIHMILSAWHHRHGNTLGGGGNLRMLMDVLNGGSMNNHDMAGHVNEGTGK